MKRQESEDVKKWRLVASPSRLRLRQAGVVPVLTTMCHWLKEQQAQAGPKSPMGQAIGSAPNHWQALTRYTEHGFLAIDINVAEPEMERMATGRKNYSASVRRVFGVHPVGQAVTVCPPASD